MNRATPRPDGRHLILYDGVCGLCNRLNAFVLPRDPDARFRFAPLQSSFARTLLERHGRNPDDLSTWYVVADYGEEFPNLLSEARAALFVARELGYPWRLACVLGILPDGLLNAAYRLIARNRYRLFGRYDSCMMPQPGYKNRFIDI